MRGVVAGGQAAAGATKANGGVWHGADQIQYASHFWPTKAKGGVWHGADQIQYASHFWPIKTKGGAWRACVCARACSDSAQ